MQSGSFQNVRDAQERHEECVARLAAYRDNFGANVATLKANLPSRDVPHLQHRELMKLLKLIATEYAGNILDRIFDKFRQSKIKALHQDLFSQEGNKAALLETFVQQHCGSNRQLLAAINDFREKTYLLGHNQLLDAARDRLTELCSTETAQRQATAIAELTGTDVNTPIRNAVDNIRDLTEDFTTHLRHARLLQHLDGRNPFDSEATRLLYDTGSPEQLLEHSTNFTTRHTRRSYAELFQLTAAPLEKLSSAKTEAESLSIRVNSHQQADRTNLDEKQRDCHGAVRTLRDTHQYKPSNLGDVKANVLLNLRNVLNEHYGPVPAEAALDTSVKHTRLFGSPEAKRKQLIQSFVTALAAAQSSQEAFKLLAELACDIDNTIWLGSSKLATKIRELSADTDLLSSSIRGNCEPHNDFGTLEGTITVTDNAISDVQTSAAALVTTCTEAVTEVQEIQQALTLLRDQDKIDQLANITAHLKVLCKKFQLNFEEEEQAILTAETPAQAINNFIGKCTEINSREISRNPDETEVAVARALSARAPSTDSEEEEASQTSPGISELQHETRNKMDNIFGALGLLHIQAIEDDQGTSEELRPPKKLHTYNGSTKYLIGTIILIANNNKQNEEINYTAKACLQSFINQLQHDGSLRQRVDTTLGELLQLTELPNSDKALLSAAIREHKSAPQEAISQWEAFTLNNLANQQLNTTSTERKDKVVETTYRTGDGMAKGFSKVRSGLTSWTQQLRSAPAPTSPTSDGESSEAKQSQQQPPLTCESNGEQTTETQVDRQPISMLFQPRRPAQEKPQGDDDRTWGIWWAERTAQVQRLVEKPPEPMHGSSVLQSTPERGDEQPTTEAGGGRGLLDGLL